MSSSVQVIVDPALEVDVTVHVRNASGPAVENREIAAKRAESPAERSERSERSLESEAKPRSGGRIVALDAFRGLTILGMLLVNNIALDEATPRQLLHAEWNHGVTFADMVFPWFLLIVGISIPLGGRRATADVGRYVGRVVTRALLLFALGCLVDSSIYGKFVVCLGVLQLIALSYGVAALVSLMGPWPRLVVASALLFVHWFLLRFYPVPGLGAGLFTPAHNFANYINAGLEPYHLRGLFSLFTSSALVLLGTLAGEIVKSKKDQKMDAAIDLGLFGAALIFIGIVWNLDLPYNKTVWTSSYVCCAGGWGCVTLAAMIVVADVWRCTALSFPLVVFGTNATTAYALPILLKTMLLQKLVVTLRDGSHLNAMDCFLHDCVVKYGRIPGGWVYTLVYIGAIWLLLYAMYRKRLFVRL